MSSGGSLREIIASLAVNVAIACAKAVAAVMTRSGAMLAETLHSFADCGNQLLLLVGLRQARRAPDAAHPLGRGRELYFWSFIVALLLFFGGGVFSIREGVEKILHPERVANIGVALAILVFSLALEGWSTLGNVRAINKRRPAGTTFYRYLRETKDSDLIVVFGENGAAVVGLLFALVALALARETGDGRWDGIGSLAIGLVLVTAATFLAREIKSLLVGEAADPSIRAAVDQVAGEMPDIERVLNVLAIQQGPGEVIVAAKLEFRPGLSGEAMVDTINAFERALKSRAPDVRWSFVEPDRGRS